jgi:cytochrome b subunit of formate dehydrogenase
VLAPRPPNYSSLDYERNVCHEPRKHKEGSSGDDIAEKGIALSSAAAMSVQRGSCPVLLANGAVRFKARRAEAHTSSRIRRQIFLAAFFGSHYVQAPRPMGSDWTVMKIARIAASKSAGVLFGLLTFVALQPDANAIQPALGVGATPVQPSTEPAEALPNEACLGCHGNEGFSAPREDGTEHRLDISEEKFSSSAHGKRQCTECHADIKEVPHTNIGRHMVSCVQCHQTLWSKAQSEGKTAESARLGMVVERIDHFMNSIHARPSITDQSRTNATCYNCHNPHYVYPIGTPGHAEWRRDLPNTCGKCHVKPREEYLTSVHAKEAVEGNNPGAPVCSDCHTAHDVENPVLDSTKLVITHNCGNCHQDQLRTYTQTYHGQVNQLGFAYTAKCFDCHGNHGIQRVSDPQSMVNPANRVKTCQQCHADAPANFMSFQPHGDPSDRANYPLLFWVKKFMEALLAGVFLFFWTHVALWFYREYKDRLERRARPHILTEGLIRESERKHVRRFAIGWRIAHLMLILSVMTLVLSGMSSLFAGSEWAPLVVKQLGSPKVTALLHRIAAAMFIVIFLGHLVYALFRIVGSGKAFNFFGPTSMVPNLQDIKDIGLMFKWFFGKGPRPTFERWTYWEKFDYWAVFWGIGVIGGSGLMLWSPTVTAQFLPGWMFNVATIFHGEEAILAAVFLFTVHFFNNHFRPDKFPLDVVMFTGSMPLEEFRREHTREYDRLVQSGELSKRLVDAPSRPMTTGSRILGFSLLAIGLMLLVLVGLGIFGTGA